MANTESSYDDPSCSSTSRRSCCNNYSVPSTSSYRLQFASLLGSLLGSNPSLRSLLLGGLHIFRRKSTDLLYMGRDKTLSSFDG